MKNTLSISTPQPSRQRRAPKAPTVEQLQAASDHGLILRNSDNGRVFRVVYVEAAGLSGIRIYDPPSAKRPVRDPIMGSAALFDWLSHLELASG